MNRRVLIVLLFVFLVIHLPGVAGEKAVRLVAADGDRQFDRAGDVQQLGGVAEHRCPVNPTTAEALEVTLFGPEQFIRTTGRPNVFIDSFLGITGEALLIVKNGENDGSHRVSSALVGVNDLPILRTNDFGQNVSDIAVPIVIGENNTISVELRGKPGGYLTIWIKTDVAVDLVAGEAGRALEEPNKLLVALPIENRGTTSAQNVQVTAATLPPSGLLSPVFPVALGDIAPNAAPVFEPSFTSADLVPGDPYTLSVSGTFMVGAVSIDFTLEQVVRVPQIAPGQALLQYTSATPSVVSGAPYPPVPMPADIVEGFNEERRPPTPTGQLRGTLQPSPNLSSLAPGTPVNGALEASESLNGVADPVVFVQSSQFGTYNGTWLDLSGATSNDVVAGSFNGPVAFSSDGGATFWTVNVTAVFPNTDPGGNLIDGGFCCDQVIQYVPQIDRFVWLMQFRRGLLPTDVACTGQDSAGNNIPPGCGPNGPNRYRLAVASPQQIVDSGATAWTYWDLTSGLFGFGNNWMDYPDLAVGDNFLYFSADVLGGGGLFVGRIALSDLQAGGVITIGFTDPALGSMAWASHLVQNVTATAYWAGHNSTSQIRIFDLPENSDFYSWRDVNIDSWPNDDYTSPTPNGVNWLAFGFPGSAIIGATRVLYEPFGSQSDELWLSWTAARGGGFPQPHVQVVRIDSDDYSKLSQAQIWNNDIAFAYPALASNILDQVGVALAFGGGEAHANFAVGIYGDHVVYYPALGDASRPRFGDYFGIRRHWPNSGLFSAFGMRFTLNDPAITTDCTVTPGCSTNLHYILFGRESVIGPEPPPVPR